MLGIPSGAFFRQQRLDRLAQRLAHHIIVRFIGEKPRGDAVRRPRVDDDFWLGMFVSDPRDMVAGSVLRSRQEATAPVGCQSTSI